MTTADLAAAYGLTLRVGQFDLRAADEVASFGLGLLLMGLLAVRAVSRRERPRSPLNGPDAPVNSAR